MESMIEVTVEDNIVSKYKRLIYDFVVEDSYVTVEKSFIEAIDNLNIDKSNTNIDEMKLVYKFDNIDEPININWLINLENQDYFESVTYGG